MRHALPLLLIGAAALGACSPEPEAAKPTPTPSPSATPIPVVFASGWTEFWPDAANAIDVLNRTGARLGEYKPAGKVYRSEAVPTPLDLKPTDNPNTVYITAEGDRSALATLTYRLDVTQPDQGDAAAKSLGEMVVNSYRSLGLDGAKDVAAALTAGKGASGIVTGADYHVARSALPGGKPGTYRLTVTFNRTGANRPANS